MVCGKMDGVAELQSKANFSVVAEPLPSPPVIERPLGKTVGLDSLFDNVWMQLQDDKVRSVGLYGIVGVGKTTLLNRINNEFLKSRVEFDAVIWVTVSRPANVEKVQQVLFNKLEIPKAMFNVLKTKKIVILLDDIWEPLDLFLVGIPPVIDGNKSKVVFTTQFSTVCQDMGAKGIEVKCLAWEEAFALFQTRRRRHYIFSSTYNQNRRRLLPMCVMALQSSSQARIAQVALVGESEYAYVRVPCLCFLKGLYSAEENVTVVLIRHFDFLS
ncbi:hypothetical protein PVL29_026304 [Vitis rotundifolia]|uniref:AAA+ ATPase domain-containing protein n=1 Tax=Vitis rotundifolia TaxID=103349 RepID=A0AA38YM41_VITRO|nr:hypothetical protein PVL29_026304 [Vitis rotundifolia]